MYQASKGFDREKLSHKKKKRIIIIKIAQQSVGFDFLEMCMAISIYDLRNFTRASICHFF